MNWMIMTRSYNSYGGNKQYGFIGELLNHGTGEYGIGIAEVSILVLFTPVGPPRKTLESMYDEYKESLKDYPKVKYFRKKRRIEIQYLSQLHEPDYQSYYGPHRYECLRNAFQELRTQLHMMDDRLKPKDDFDLKRFHADVTAVFEGMSPNDEDLATQAAEFDRLRKERLDRMDPWEKADVDWKKFHPDAKRLLDDVFFWSMTDDFSPHGNDTGADALADFRKWNKKNSDRPAWGFVPKLFKSWGMEVINPDATTEPEVRELLATREMEFDVFDEAMLATAFAAIKLRGCCDAATRRLALNSIMRQRLVCEIARQDWEHLNQRLETLGKMEKALMNTPLSAQ